MTFFSRLVGWAFGFATGQRTGTQVAAPSVSVYDNTPAVGVDGALQVSTVWACVKLLVETIGSLPVEVYRKDSTGKRVLANDDFTYRLFHGTPNRRQTAQEFWEYMLLNLFLRGNCFARLERNSRGDVVSMWPLSADQVEVSVLGDGSLVYTYSLESKDFIFTENDIVHIRSGMSNGVVGLSTLDYMRSSIGLAVSAQNHTVSTYRKQARRPGILMSDNVLSDPQRKRLKENFGEIVTGGSQELFVLEAQFKFEPLGMTPGDLQLLETRKFTVEDIGRWFGVPSVLVNHSEDTTKWGTGVREILDGFYKLTVRPQLERIESTLTYRVLTPAQRAAGLMVEFNFDALLRASLKDRMDIYAKAVQNGIKTRNECRKLENYEPIEGADFLTAQTNLAPLDMLGKIQGGSDVPEESVAQ